MRLVTDLSQAGRENIFLEVMAYRQERSEVRAK